MTKKAINKEIQSWLSKKNPDYRAGVQLYYKYQPGRVKIFPKEPTDHHRMRLKIALQGLIHQTEAPQRGPVKEEEKEPATPQEQLQAMDLSDDGFDYHAGIDLATDLELELEDRKKDTVLEALREAKSKLQSDE